MNLWVIVACFAVYMYFQERYKKRVSYVVHIQERTEEAETIDFAVTLFEDETQGTWDEKMAKAFGMAEARRGFNNQRLIDMQNKFRKEQEELNKSGKIEKIHALKK